MVARVKRFTEMAGPCGATSGLALDAGLHVPEPNLQGCRGLTTWPVDWGTSGFVVMLFEFSNDFSYDFAARYPLFFAASSFGKHLRFSSPVLFCFSMSL